MNDRYDVIVGGSGIAGSTASMILAKHDLDVLMVEAKTHPRFAIGEGMLPLSAVWMWIVGEYFGIPEIQNLSDANKVVDNITRSCGVKHSVGFAYHESDHSFDGEHAHQLVPPQMPFYKESHLLREHIDHYMVESAESYGVEYVDETPITDVEIGDDEVTVTTDGGVTTGEFYIDATGGNSVVAEKMGYRDETPELATDSRAIFTHVEGLEPFDELIDEADHPQQSNRLHDGTLHHVFDGGWLWVIPFDNFERSEETKASVGLVLDREQYPRDDSLDAEAEFYEIVREFPDIERHLDPVEPVMPWIRTGRLQRSATKSSGHRHYLTNHTYGFVDPLYSQGLIHTFESVFLSTNLLLEAFEDDDFSADRFEPIDELHRRQLESADLLVRNGYDSTGDFDVWNAWTQMVLAESVLPDLYIQRFCLKYFSSGETSEFDPLLEETRPGDRAPFAPEKEALLQTMSETLDSYAAGDLPPDEASQLLLDELKRTEWLPKRVYEWGNETERHIDFSDPEIARDLFEWGNTDAPEHIREGLFDFEMPNLAQ
ncbi:NAD(P)/FAD-dependent oxidoreductase [Halorussus amylolyticus]|uniref:NAD(P)/FAD-dependent oxidoreductase n=1 Tax=Halorussus amylolyticus TaxID=1126242 RepID=UPI00138F561A|nr:tryptophan 7-halogenase [Halorussus amylolyticus]